MLSVFYRSFWGTLIIGFLFFIKNSLAIVPAGTIIGNAATATYYDENNNLYTTTSNIVQTVVQAVCGVDIYPNETLSKEGVPGQIVYLPFQIKNTGNSKNTFSLSIQNGSYTKNIYLDENQNGILDPGEQVISSLTLGMDEIASILIAVEIPSDANTGDIDTFTLQASSMEIGVCSDSGNGEVKVLTDATFLFNKAVNKSIAKPGETITYTISFKNTGIKSAIARDGYSIDIDNDGIVDNDIEGILLKDQIPDGSIYLSNSAYGEPTTNPVGFVVFSIDGVNWFQDTATLNGEVKFIGFFMQDQDPQDNNLDPVLSPDQQGTFTFKVRVVDPYTGNGSIDNMASLEYKTSAGVDRVIETNETHTKIPVSEQADILLGPFNNPEEDVENNWEDDNTLQNVPAGSWVIFKHSAKNNGNLDDVINLKIDQANTNLPQGSIVEFWNGDLSAKLIDSDLDGNIDLGTLQKGTTKDFVVKVYIPANTPPSDNDGNIDYYLTIEGISKNNPIEIDRTRDNIDGILSASVDIGKWNTVGDLINNPADNDTDGNNDSDDILPSDNGKILKVITDVEKCSETVVNIVNPGEIVIYPIEILNRGAFADSFTLKASNYVGTLKFFIDENCDGIFDQEITNTPVLGGTTLSLNASAGDTDIYINSLAGFRTGDIIYIEDEKKEISNVDLENKKITLKTPLASDHLKGSFVSEAAFVVAKIQIPEDQQPGEFNVIIEAKSENSNAQDSMDAYLKVNSVNKVIIVPNGSDQLPPGGTTTYQHTIVNKGNSSVNLKVTLPIDTKLTYIILDNDQNPQGTEFLIPIALNPNDSYTVYIKTIAPSDIQPGTVETVKISIVDADNDSLIYDTAEDTTTVIEGFMQLTKSVDKKEVKPGDTVTYIIKYKNIGDKTAINVVITDNIPNYTDYVPNSMCIDENCDGSCDQNISDSFGDDIGEYDQNNNLVRFRVGSGADSNVGGSVEPGEEGCLMFKVKVQE